MVREIVRCPYCVDFELNGFVPMIRISEGRYTCGKCGHIASPANKDYRCSCRRCAVIGAFDPDNVWVCQSA
jgi:hypothetical protein